MMPSKTLRSVCKGMGGVQSDGNYNEGRRFLISIVLYFCGITFHNSYDSLFCILCILINISLVQLCELIIWSLILFLFLKFNFYMTKNLKRKYNFIKISHPLLVYQRIYAISKNTWCFLSNYLGSPPTDVI